MNKNLIKLRNISVSIMLFIFMTFLFSYNEVIVSASVLKECSNVEEIDVSLQNIVETTISEEESNIEEIKQDENNIPTENNLSTIEEIDSIIFETELTEEATTITETSSEAISGEESVIIEEPYEDIVSDDTLVPETLYTTSSIYVRPSKGSTESLGIIAKDSKVIGYREGEWIRFTYNGQEAYIVSRLTTTKAPILIGTLNLILNEARKWIGTNERNNGHHFIIDTYNNQPNLPRGTKFDYNVHWCDIFVSFIGIRTNTTHIIGSEAYVPFHMDFFRKRGQWIENGSTIPRPGDLAFFNWSVSSQPNYALPGHISIVESVHDGYFYSIDGNVFQDGEWGVGYVVRRQYAIGQGEIRGFARPAYQ